MTAGGGESSSHELNGTEYHHMNGHGHVKGVVVSPNGINGHANKQSKSNGFVHRQRRPTLKVNSPNVVYHTNGPNSGISSIESTYFYDSSSVTKGDDGEYVVTPIREEYKLLTDVASKPSR